MSRQGVKYGLVPDTNSGLVMACILVGLGLGLVFATSVVEAGITTEPALYGRSLLVHENLVDTGEVNVSVSFTNSVDVVAGDCFEIVYFHQQTGAAPPQPPDEVNISLVGHDASSVYLLRVVTSGAAPTPGQTYEVCATSNGLAGGTPFAGHLYLTLIAEDTGIGGWGPISTSTVAENPTSFTECPNLQNCGYEGVFLSRMLVSQMDDSGPPSGTTYAIGVAGDESISYTVANSDTYASASHQLRLGGNLAGSPVGLPIRTLTASDTPNVESYVVAEAGDATGDVTGHAQRLFVDSDNPLTVTSSVGGSPQTVKWTKFNTTQPSAVTYVSDREVMATDSMNWSTAWVFGDMLLLPTSGPTTDFGLYNRAETVSWTFRVLNARSEALTRIVNVNLRPTSGTESFNVTDTGSPYLGSASIAVGAESTFDFIGEPHFFRITLASGTGNGVLDSSSTVGVSNRYRADSHTSLNSTLEKDFFPNDDVSEIMTFVISADVMHVWCHVANARGDTDIDTSSTSLIMEIRNPTGGLEDSRTTQTQSDGWTNPSFSFAATAPAGTWSVNCLSVGSTNGNTWSDTELVGMISAFTGDIDVVIYVNPDTPLSEEFTLLVESRRNGQSIQPDVPIQVQIRRIIEVDGQLVIDNLTTEYEQTLNVNNWTTTVNGTLYAKNYTIDEVGIYNVGAFARVQGAAIYVNEPFNVGGANATVGAEVAMLEIDNLDASSLTELAIYAGILLFGLWRGYWLMSLIGVMMVFRPFVLTAGGPWPSQMNFTFGIIFSMLFLVVHYLADNRRAMNEEEEGL